MRWIPVVTLFQAGLDLALAVGTPEYGHDCMARHDIPAWAAMRDPEGRTDADAARLRAHLDGLVPR